MSTKRLLLALPVAILALLLQSALWVPTLASQGDATPRRLRTFVKAQVGDTKRLNPIVNSDYDADMLMRSNVFEGLVWPDENLKVAPKLADRWETSEDAYVAILPERRLADGKAATAALLLERIQDARQRALLGGLERSIEGMELVPSEERALTETVLIKNEKGKEEPADVEMTLRVPERVRLRLSKVEPDLFERLAEVLGKDYFAPGAFPERFTLKKPEQLQALRPKLPDLFTVGEHNPILTFHLHPGVRWHDGVPLTAEDVKFTYEAFIDPKNASPQAGSFRSIKSVEVIDELTARITYRRLYSPAIIDWMEPLVPKHALDDGALKREMERRHLSPDERTKLSLRNSDFNRNPIGTGPFKFVEWQPGQFIHLARNDHYWGQPPEYQDFFLRNISDYLSMELEFRAGAVDMYLAQPHQAARYRADSRYHVLPNNDGNYAYIGYNERLPMFQDRRVRKALGMAIDADAIIAYVLSGEGKRCAGPYYSITPYHDPDLKPLPYDPQGALSLLEEAGWHKNAAGKLEKDGKPFAFTVVTNAGNQMRKAIMIIAQQAWLALGIDVKIQDFEWTVFLEDFVETNHFDAVVMAWGGGAINPDQFPIWHSSQTHHYESNHIGYQSAAADELIMKIRTTYDEQEQIKLTRQLDRLIAEDHPYTFIYERQVPYVYDRRTAIVERDAQGVEHPKEIEVPPSGDVLHSFRTWRKFSNAPEPLR
ncbi:MAG TPA: ABC transporter substrate-binding protein [Polyangiaceae bacterium]|nr:ABC transporter substrate-binding protein [Polyangiaceae bacterium]